MQIDKVLEALYDSNRSAGLGSSCPNVNRWLGDIRTYFPKAVVQVMQKDALERLHLQKMLLEPETLETVEADIHLIGTLLALNNVIPKKTRETARRVVRKVVEDLERQLRNPLTEAVRGALSWATHTSRPRTGEIDWHRTIRKNLHNYIAERRTIIAERLVGYGRRRSSLRDIVLCIDQSGSMAASVVYSSVFGAVLASLARSPRGWWSSTQPSSTLPTSCTTLSMSCSARSSVAVPTSIGPSRIAASRSRVPIKRSSS